MHPTIMQVNSHQPLPHPRDKIQSTLYYSLLLLVLLFSTSILPAQAATPLTGNPLNDGYHDLYNLDFAGAHAHFEQWMAAHPEDPMGPAADAAAWLFGEFDRLHIIDVQLFTDQSRFDNRDRLTPDPAVREHFDDRADKASGLADTAIRHNPKDANALYVKTLISGMRSDYALMIEKRDYAALNYSKEATAYSKQALAADPTLYDAHLASGVENYMLSLKWAPLRWLLNFTGSSTSREEGLRLLHLTAEKGHYLAPFARMMLAVAALRDNRPQEARDILAALSHEYPQNTMYARELARIH
jgi:hypothetical protein